MFLLYFTLRHRERPDHLNRPLGGPNMTPKRRPGAARDAPGAAEKASRQLQERQKRPKSAQSRPNTASERPWRPSWAQLAQKIRPEASRRPFWTSAGRCSTLRGTIFVKLSCGQSLRKHTPSTALLPCVTSTCGLVRRRTEGQFIYSLIN